LARTHCGSAAQPRQHTGARRQRCYDPRAGARDARATPTLAPHTQVWSLRVDVHVLDAGGNLIDAACLAALAALLVFRKPQVEVDQSSGEGEAQITVYSPDVSARSAAGACTVCVLCVCVCVCVCVCLGERCVRARGKRKAVHTACTLPAPRCLERSTSNMRVCMCLCVCAALMSRVAGARAAAAHAAPPAPVSHLCTV
jgi:hypothetical protein